jgi:hypothetical protein
MSLYYWNNNESDYSWMDNTVMAARSGDSDLELMLLQGEGWVLLFLWLLLWRIWWKMWFCMENETGGGGGVELSMMEEQQIFICISDAFF